MPLSLTQTALVRIVAGQAITNNLLRLLALSPSVSISGSVATADLADGAVTPAKTSPGAYFYGALSGTNAYTLTLSPALSAYANGVDVLGKVGNSNTAAAAASLDVNSLGAKNVYHRSGLAVKAGDLVANDIVRFRYNTSRNSGAGGWDIMEVIPSATIRPASNDTAGTANTQTVVNTPPLTGYTSGLMLLVKVGSGLTNTGALTLNCDSLGARNVLHVGGRSIGAGDWLAGQTYLLYDDGTQFILLARHRVDAVVAASRGLEMRQSSTTQAVLTADEVVLKYNGSGASLLVQSVNVTIDITLGVDLNGFETGGSRTTNRWYYVWLISDGTNVRAVLEDSGSADGAVPAGPDLSGGAFSGYVYSAMVGQIRLNATGSGEIVNFWQYDRRVWTIEHTILVASNKGSVDTWQILDDTGTADLTAFRAVVPPTGKSCSGFCGCPDAEQDGRLMLAAAANDGTLASANLGVLVFNLSEMVGTTEYGGFGSSAQFADLPVRGGASRNIQWQNQTLDDPVSLSVNGYTF